MVGCKSPNPQHNQQNRPSMHINQTPRQYQQQRTQKFRLTTLPASFLDILSSDELHRMIEAALPQCRQRLYPPMTTLAMFISQSLSNDRSCQNAVNQSALKGLVQGNQTISTHTGGYCRARQRLPSSLVRQLTQHIGRSVTQKTPIRWHWNGRPIRLVDGTTVTMPDTHVNQKQFPQSPQQKPGLGFPMCRLVGITCLSSGVLLNAAMGPCCGKGSNEQSLLRQIQNTFERGDIVMGDAFFATYFLIAELQERGVDILMEQHGSRKKSTDFRKGQKLGKHDHLIELIKPKTRPEWMTETQYEQAPERVTVRELRVGKKILVTTLSNSKKHPKESLKTLYKQRWHVELDIRAIKETMGMNVLSCKSPEMIEKEIWVYLLGYNLIRVLMAESAERADVQPRLMSFKHCVQLWNCYRGCIDQFTEEQWHLLLVLMSQQRVGNRPDRIEPRAVKRRPKPYPLLMKTRDEARAEILKSGHAKKLK